MDLSFLTQATLLGNTPLRWLSALAVAALVTLGLRLARRLTRRRLRAFAHRTRFSFDDVIVDVLAETHSLSFLVAGVYAGSAILALPEQARTLVGPGFVLVMLVQVALWGNRALVTVLERYRTNVELDSGRRTTAAALGFVGRLVLFSLVLLLGLENLGVHVTTLVAGLGITSLAVALALQNLLGDLFASLSIVFDKPFEIGDFIIVGDHMGSVEHVGLRTTRVRSLSGEQLVFPNNDLLTSRIRNYKRMEERRVVFPFGVTYDTPRPALEEIPAVVREIVEAQQDVRFDRSHFKAFGAYSLDFETVYYVLTSDYNRYMDIQQTINLALFHAFDERGIAFAFPTQSLVVERWPGAPRWADAGGPEGEGDAAAQRRGPRDRPGAEPTADGGGAVPAEGEQR